MNDQVSWELFCKLLTHTTLPRTDPVVVSEMTDKANEQGWGSTVKAASEQIKSATDAVAEKIRPTVGNAVADGLKTGGDYTKAGIQNTGDALGLKGSKVCTHQECV